MKTILVTTKDKQGNELDRFEMDAPETIQEAVSLLGEKTALSYLINQMKIAERAKRQRKGSGGGGVRGVPKTLKQELKEALKQGKVSLQEIEEFLRAKGA